MAGKVLSGVDVATDDHVDVVDRQPSIGKGCTGGLFAERGRRLIGACDMALANAGALKNPFVRRVDDLFHFGIGHDALRKRSPEPADN